MYYDREITTLNAELYERGNIPCAALGRKVLDTECSRRILGANTSALQVCLACPGGHSRAATCPWSPQGLLSLTKPISTPAKVVEQTPAPKPKAARNATAKRQAKSAPAVPAAPDAPHIPALPEALAKLASVLRELTADGRMRVSMLDVMRCLDAPNYDATEALVIQAGLRTSRLHGPVQAVLVDYNMRALMERAASEVRQ